MTKNIVTTWIFYIMVFVYFNLTLGKIKVPPPYQNIVSSEGSSITLVCQTPHDNSYDVIAWWRNDSSNIVAQKEETDEYIDKNYTGRATLDKNEFTLAACEVGDSSFYYCETSRNGKTVVGKFIKVTVRQSPGCDKLRKNVESIEETSVLLSCAVLGNPVPTIKWTKMSSNEKFSSRFVISEKGLSIQNLNVNDSGKYQVSLTNIHEQFNTIVTLVVRSVASIKPENYKSAIEGEPVVVVCGKNPARNPTDTFEWLKGSEDLSLNNRFSIDKNGSLVIKKSSRLDTGLYTCASKRKASDGSDTSTSVQMYLNVRYVPVISIILPYVEVYENMNAVLPCSASGNPGVNFRWLYPNGALIKQSEKFQIATNGSLIILNVHMSDVMNYTCAPYNKIGSGRYGYTQLKILIPPKFINEQKAVNIRVKEGEDVSLDCSASGQPKPNVTWEHNRILQPGNDDEKKYTFNSVGILTINNILGSDHGRYICSAESVAGTSLRSYNITVIAKPGVPMSFGVLTVDNFAYIFWKPAHDGGSLQSFEFWYRRADDNDYNWEVLTPSVATLEKKELKYTVTVLLKGPAKVGGHGEAYFFCARSKNKEGYSSFTNIYKVLKSSVAGVRNTAEDVGPIITDIPLAPYDFTVNISTKGYALKWKHMLTPGRPIYAGYSIEYRTANTSNGWKEYVPKQRSRRSSATQGQQEQVSISVDDLADVKHPLEFQVFSIASNNVKSTGTKPRDVIVTGMPGPEAKASAKESDDLIPPIVLGIIFGLFIIILIISLYCFCRRRKKRYNASRNEMKMVAYNKEQSVYVDARSMDSNDNTNLLSPKFVNNDSPRRFHLRACPALTLGKYNNHNLSNGTAKDDVYVLLEPNDDEKRVCTCNKKYMTLNSREQKTKREKKKGLYKSTSSPSVLLTSDMDGSSIDPAELLDEEDYDISDIEKDDIVDLSHDKQQRFPSLNRKNFKDSYDQFCRDGIDGSRRRLSSNDKTEVDKNMETKLVLLKDVNDASSENSATESDRVSSPKAKPEINDKTYDGKSSGFGDGSNSTSDSESIHQEMMDKPALLRPISRTYGGQSGYISDSGYRRDPGYASDISTRSSPLDYVGRHKYLPPSQRHNLNYNRQQPPLNYFSEDEGATRLGYQVSPRPFAPPSYNQAMVDIERMSEKNEITDSEEMYDNLLEMERQLGITLDDSLDSELNIKTLLPPRPYSNPRTLGSDTEYMSDAPVVLAKDKYSDREKTARCAQLLSEFKSNRRAGSEEEEEEKPVIPPTDRSRSVMDNVTDEPRVPPVLRRSNSAGSSSVYKEWLV